MSRIIESLKDFFDKNNLHYSVVPEAATLKLPVSQKNGQWECLAVARGDRYFVFYSVYPKLIKSDRRSFMAEFLMRANDSLNYGNFEMNLATGRVAYKTSIRVDHTPLTTTLIKPVVCVNIKVMNHYLTVIESVANGTFTEQSIASQAKIL